MSEQSPVNSLFKMLGNMVPVIGGVLIALFIENWKEQEDDKRFLTKEAIYVSIENLLNTEYQLQNAYKEYLSIEEKEPK